MSSFKESYVGTPGFDVPDPLKLIEQKIDNEQEKKKTRNHSAERRGSGASMMEGRLRSGSETKRVHSASISVPSHPVKTTVGFGQGSVTKMSLEESSPLAGSSGTHKSLKVEDAKQQKGQKSQQKKPDGHNPPPGGYPKKPKLTKKERRELQERQRAEKAAAKADGGKKSSAKKMKQVSASMQADNEKKQMKKSKTLAKQNVPERTVATRQVRLFSHLTQFERSVPLTKGIHFGRDTNLHPAIVRLGLKMSEGLLTGSTERCIAMLLAFKKVFNDYITPPGKEISRDLSECIKPYISFLVECRPLSVSMGNAIKYIKHEITHELPPTMPEQEAKDKLIGSVERYLSERIMLAKVVIAQLACEKIEDGDTVLVHSLSNLLVNILKTAWKNGKKFRVIVVDSRPKLQGKVAASHLTKIGIPCSYTLISSLSYVMREVSKVFITAHALLANGYVMGRVGSSMISLMARFNNVPVLVCCETFKFSDRVQTDSFVFNELGDPNDLCRAHPGVDPVLNDWMDVSTLKLLNLVYDVTPPDFISMVITEVGVIPCTSVPVVLRVKDSYKG